MCQATVIFVSVASYAHRCAWSDSKGEILMQHGKQAHTEASGESPYGPSRLWLGIIIVLNILIIGGLSYNLARPFIA